MQSNDGRIVCWKVSLWVWFWAKFISQIIRTGDLRALKFKGFLSYIFVKLNPTMRLSVWLQISVSPILVGLLFWLVPIAGFAYIHVMDCNACLIIAIDLLWAHSEKKGICCEPMLQIHKRRSSCLRGRSWAAGKSRWWNYWWIKNRN